MNSNPFGSLKPQTYRSSRRVFYGWVILAISFVISLLAWGIYYSFGVFFTELQSTFNANRAEISLISSIIIGTIYTTGLIYGWAIDRYDPRLLIGAGGILICTGLVLSSFAVVVWQLYITLGFLVGFGIGAIHIPYISVITRWFVRKRGLAIGIQTSGGSVGMMVMAPLSEKLISTYGWRITFVSLGITSLILFGISALIVRGYPQEKGLAPYGETTSDQKERPKVGDVSSNTITSGTKKGVSLSEAMKGRDFWLVFGIRVMISVTIFMVNMHLVNYAKDAGMSAANAAMLMTVVGAVSIFGKVGAGHLSDRVGSKIIVIASSSALAVMMVWFSSTMGTLMLPVSAAVYGLAYGGSFPILNTIVAERFGVKEIGKILAFVNIGSAVGSLVGPWLAGYLFDATASYSVAFLVAAGTSLAVVLLAIPFGKHRGIGSGPAEQSCC